MANDRPLGDFVAEMLTTLGSTYEHPRRAFIVPIATLRQRLNQSASFPGRATAMRSLPQSSIRQNGDRTTITVWPPNFTTLERKQVDNIPKTNSTSTSSQANELIQYKEKSRQPFGTRVAPPRWRLTVDAVPNRERSDAPAADAATSDPSASNLLR